MTALWAVLGGIVAICLGAIGLVYWWAFFLKALAATVPAILIFGGAIALFIGISELRDSLKSKEETDFSDYKTESKVEEKGEEEKPEGEKAKPKKTSKK
ncbi:MAG: hypothetical protein ACMUIL_10195 [bacterium]